MIVTLGRREKCSISLPFSLHGNNRLRRSSEVGHDGVDGVIEKMLLAASANDGGGADLSRAE